MREERRLEAGREPHAHGARRARLDAGSEMMTDARARRQRIIADLLRAEPIGSQEEVTERLSSQGLAVTQATVSRDLDQLGAVKVKRGGALRYVLPDEMGDTGWAVGRLGRIFAEW